MELRVEKIDNISSKILAILFVELAQESSVCEVLSGAIYAAEKFKAAVSELDVVPREVCELFEQEVKAGAIKDLNNELIGRVKTLLKGGQML